MVGAARVTVHRLLAAVALVLGVLALFAGSPYANRGIDVRRLAKEVAEEKDHVTATELATWIRERKPRLRVLDLRTQREFDAYHVPGSERIPLDELVTKVRFAKDETLVLISDGGAHAAQAWVFLRALGHEHVYFLRGGLGEWTRDVLDPAHPTPLTRYFGGVRRGDGC
jgi:rhodanese-related sulfurtransferase